MSILDALPERWKRDVGVALLGVLFGMFSTALYWSREIIAAPVDDPEPSHSAPPPDAAE